MNPFLKHAEEIFTTAAEAAGEDCAVAILVGHDGCIRMLQARDWGLEPLQVHHGAREAYLVQRSAGRVRLEARSGAESCVLETRQPEPTLGGALTDFPRYVTS